MMKKLIRRLRALFGKFSKKGSCCCCKSNGNLNKQDDDDRLAVIMSRLQAVEQRMDDSLNMIGGVDASEFLNRFQMLEDKVDELDGKIKKVQKEN